MVEPYLKFLFLLFIVFSSNSSYSFSWQKCKSKQLSKFDASGGLGLTSSTQFTSSWGPCSALGMTKEKNAHLFFAINNDKIIEDIAKGDGEYFIALNRLWECNKNSALKGSESLRMSFSELLKLGFEEQYYYIKQRSEYQADKG